MFPSPLSPFQFSIPSIHLTLYTHKEEEPKLTAKSQILTSQIRSEIASCSETAYPSLPISSTKNLLFLDSEGAVVEFAKSRGWTITDGRIYFPKQGKSGADDAGSQMELSRMTIENTLGYARELETIV